VKDIDSEGEVDLFFLRDNAAVKHRHAREILKLHVLHIDLSLYRGRRGRDRMVIGFTTICAISAYHH
jgi:hypothetical protein